MTNYEDTNNAVHHLRFQAALDEAVDEEAAFHAFEEHFKASAEDPYFEFELKLWLTAWRKALDYFTRQAAPARRTLTMTNDTDPVRELVDQWREVAEYFTGSTGLDIRETLIDCADDLEAALAQQQTVHPASTHCDNCGCDWLDNGLNPIGCPYCKQSDDAKILVAERDALEAENERLREDAERYRCLSSMATQQADYLGPIFRIDVRRTTPQTLFNFDAAVDHARAALEQENSND